MDNNTSSLLPFSLEDVFQMTSLGSRDSPITNTLFGFNHRQTPSGVPLNKDHFGLTFFTRPQLNMTSGNLNNTRHFTQLLTQEEKSYGRFIRCTLDPRLMVKNMDDPRMSGNISTPDKLKCPLLDNEQAFIPLLTNHLKSISGWPDLVVKETTTKTGAYGEEHSMVDNFILNYGSYELSATFRNMRGNPILALIHFWAMYQSFVFEGRLVPYMDMISENEIDYNTRIYRVTLDQTKKLVTNICCTGASFIGATPIGGLFDFSDDKPYNDANNTFTVPFKSNGAIYNDYLAIKSFNTVTTYFNESMLDTVRDSRMVKVPIDNLPHFNYRGYPRIDPDTMELEWYVRKDDYNSKLKAINEYLGLVTQGKQTDNNYSNLVDNSESVVRQSTQSRNYKQDKGKLYV